MSKIYFIKEQIKPTISLYDYTYTPDAFTITYDGQDHTPNFVVKNPDDTTLTENIPDEYGVIYSINTNVKDWTNNTGTKRVTITLKGTDTDNFTYTNDWLGTLGNTRVIGWSSIIEPATLIVRAQNASKIQGFADPPLTYIYEGNVGKEIPGFTGGISRDAGEMVGVYTINRNTLALADNDIFLASNYNMDFRTATFTINIVPDVSTPTPNP